MIDTTFRHGMFIPDVAYLGRGKAERSGDGASGSAGSKPLLNSLNQGLRIALVRPL